MAKDFSVHRENGGSAVPQDKEVAVVAPLVSIIIPCCGMLEYTRLCIGSILRHSRPPFELIFLDIGSLDGTAEYLAGVATVQGSVRVEIVHTPTDLGIKEVCRQGLGLARGQYVVLLNNDTVVSDGWLTQMTGLAAQFPEVGLVGPMSNYAAVPQLVETVPYRLGPRKTGEGRGGDLVDVEAVNAFAMAFRQKEQGKYIHVERLGGFCLLSKRDVIKRLEQQGELNLWGDLGLFDTDILSLKARQLGYNLALCRDLFIHHFGTRTFAFGAPGQSQPERGRDGLGHSTYRGGGAP